MWLKRILVPLWVIELLVLKITLVVCCLAFFTLSLSPNNDDSNDISNYDTVIHRVYIVLGVFLALTITSIIMDWIAIILFARQRLEPVTYLSMSCVKLLFWAVILVLDIVGVARASSATAASIIWPIIIVATGIGQVTYSAVMVHRKRQGTLSRGMYNPAFTQSTAYETREEQYGSGDTYQPYNPHGLKSPHQDISSVPLPPPSKIEHPAYHSPEVGSYNERRYSYEMQTPGVIR